MKQSKTSTNTTTPEPEIQCVMMPLIEKDLLTLSKLRTDRQELVDHISAVQENIKKLNKRIALLKEDIYSRIDKISGRNL